MSCGGGTCAREGDKLLHKAHALHGRHLRGGHHPLGVEVDCRCGCRHNVAHARQLAEVAKDEHEIGVRQWWSDPAQEKIAQPQETSSLKLQGFRHSVAISYDI